MFASETEANGCRWFDLLLLYQVVLRKGVTCTLAANNRKSLIYFKPAAEVVKKR